MSHNVSFESRVATFSVCASLGKIKKLQIASEGCAINMWVCVDVISSLPMSSQHLACVYEWVNVMCGVKAL